MSCTYLCTLRFPLDAYACVAIFIPQAVFWMDAAFPNAIVVRICR